jgi:hypothetical protein
VIRAAVAGETKPASGERQQVYDLAIEWRLPTSAFRTTPLVDWFTKAEYERYLTEDNPSVDTQGP